MPTTPLNALRYPALSDNANVPLYLTQLATDIDPKLGLVLYRKVAITASGTLTAAAQVNLIATQTLPAALFGAGVPYRLRVATHIRCDVVAAAGAYLDVMVGGVAYAADHQGNGGSSNAAHTLRADEVIPITSDAAQTVNVRLTSVSGTLTVTNTGRYVVIEAQPTKAL